MNIFVLDENPMLAARYHCDRHVVKMILESVQLISTAYRFYGIDVGYKSTHTNHPCARWVRESVENYYWLVNLLTELHSEWLIRFKHPKTKLHKSWELFLLEIVPREIDFLNKLPKIACTSFVQAMPGQYKHRDVVQAYRDYYIGEKAYMATWKKEQPYWWPNAH